MQAYVMLSVVMAALLTKYAHSLPAPTEQPQEEQAGQVDARGFYYPYPYANVNWYNFPYLWPAVAGGLLDPTAPLAGLGAHLTGLGTGCPTGFCPNGASCSQHAGQWQCGCAQNACVGGEPSLSTRFYSKVANC